MSSIFTKIINGDIPSFKIAEDDLFFAFLDIEPLQEGHVLIVPKFEVDKVYDAPDNYLAQYMLFAKPIAKAIEVVTKCKRVGISFIGIEVPHAHMHLVPINAIKDMDFTSKPPKPTGEALKLVQERILEALNS